MLAVLLCYGCIREFRERKVDDRGNVVYLSRDMLWAGAIGVVFFLVICWLVAVMDGSIGTMLCFSAFVILGLGLMLSWKNCCIFYDHNGFTIRNFIGRQRNLSYSQLTGYRFSRGAGSMKLYVGRKTIALDDMDSFAARDFLQEARHGYARCSGGKALPNRWAEDRNKEKTSGKGSFAAHVHNPFDYLAPFIIGIPILLATFALGAYDAWKPVGPEDCEKLAVSFSDCQIHGDKLVLRSDSYAETFRINNYENYLSGLEDLQEKCDGQTEFVAWVQLVTPKGDPDYYRIEELSADGMVYRSFADSTNDNREDLPEILLLFGGMILCLLVFSWFTYCIGCNPKKYPKWLVYTFFKRSDISF